MAYTQTRMRSESSADRWPADPSHDLPFHPTELENFERLPSSAPALRGRASRALARFLITFGIGAVATLAWQSYGDAAREVIATSSPQLAWLVPQAPPARPVPDAVAATSSAIPSSDRQQVEAMSLALAVVRQRVDQLAAQLAFNQQQMVNQIGKLQSADEEILRKVSAPASQQTAVSARKPMPVKLQPSTQEPPAR
jgi:hypothetical protein